MMTCVPFILVIVTLYDKCALCPDRARGEKQWRYESLVDADAGPFFIHSNLPPTTERSFNGVGREWTFWDLSAQGTYHSAVMRCASPLSFMTVFCCLPVCLSACLPVCLSACLPVCLSACLPVCLSACLPACLPACLLVSLPSLYLSWQLLAARNDPFGSG